MEGPPQLAPNPKADDKIDLTFKVEEQNRNQFTFGGGFSGLEGAFFNASFSTANFLGRGETVTLAAQTGARTKNYQLAITEPYVFDRAITAGFSIFLRRQTYLSYGTSVGYGEQDQGASLTSGISVGTFSRLFTTYSFQIIDIYDVDETALQGQTTGTSGLPVTLIDADDLGGAGRRYESGINASWVRNTVDNPFQPRSGTRHTLGMQFVGGVLGGTVDYYRPTVETVFYRPFGRRMALGLRGQAGWVRPFGSTEEIPYYQRYFLGGETQIRGYDVRSVAPYDATTSTSVGGDKFLLFNAEYYFDVLGPLRLLLFFDAGQAYAPGQGFWWRTMSTSTGVEARFLMPVLNVPFRLIYAWNPNRDFYQPATAFKFAVGTTF
jgi:outer membrane protein insertion porin family